MVAIIFSILGTLVKSLPIILSWIKDRQARREELEEEALSPAGRRRIDKADLDTAIWKNDGAELTRLSDSAHSLTKRLRAQHEIQKAKGRRRFK